MGPDQTKIPLSFESDLDHHMNTKEKHERSRYFHLLIIEQFCFEKKDIKVLI